MVSVLDYLYGRFYLLIYIIPISLGRRGHNKTIIWMDEIFSGQSKPQTIFQLSLEKNILQLEMF